MSRNLWFTADTHFGHKTVLAHRPFADMGEMNLVLIDNWNSVVGPMDEVWHLGDVHFMSGYTAEYWLDQLNGFIHVLKGNHDSTRELWGAAQEDVTTDGVREYSGWKRGIQNDGLLDAEGVKHWPTTKYVRQKPAKFWLSHYPHRSWQGSDREDNPTYHLHGHTHGDLLHSRGRQMDVGVDAVARHLSALRSGDTGRLIPSGPLRQEDYRPIHMDEVLEWLSGEGTTSQHDRGLVL